jgi:hypothetical protein
VAAPISARRDFGGCSPTSPRRARRWPYVLRLPSPRPSQLPDLGEDIVICSDLCAADRRSDDGVGAESVAPPPLPPRGTSRLHAPVGLPLMDWPDLALAPPDLTPAAPAQPGLGAASSGARAPHRRASDAHHRHGRSHPPHTGLRWPPRAVSDLMNM